MKNLYLKIYNKILKKEFFNRDTVKVAQDLLGKILSYKNNSGIIVETEAYKDDQASHAFHKTNRSSLMFNSYAKFYIYFTYGNWYCLNITTEKNKPGAVLIRALQPLNNIRLMQKRRKTNELYNLTNGPGKLCQAFNIDKILNGTSLNEKIKILDNKLLKNFKIIRTTRIGISKAKNLKWRFYIKDNKFVSKK